MAALFYHPVKVEDALQVQADRRRGERFPLTLDLRFRRMSKNENWTRGTSLNVSHSGILFTTSQPTYLGASLELVIDWPAKSAAASTRVLVVVGMVVRVRHNEVALSIRKYAFRSCPLPD